MKIEYFLLECEDGPVFFQSQSTVVKRFRIEEGVYAVASDSNPEARFRELYLNGINVNKNFNYVNLKFLQNYKTVLDMIKRHNEKETTNV